MMAQAVENAIQPLILDDLVLEVRPSARRKTLALIVERDGSLVVATPAQYNRERLVDFVESKRLWLYTHLAEKEVLSPNLPAKSYVSGEGFYYLGRHYRLLLVDQQSRVLKLDHGRFRLVRSQARRGRELFVRWYTNRARIWLPRRLQLWTDRVGVEPNGLEVRDMGFRWGSCGKGRILYFHWKAILLPPDIIDYLLVHELTHLKEAHHTETFWRLVEQAMPDFEQKKRWLAEKGAEVARV